jgi:glycerophosphoryl diester phosphodiesterase
MEGNTKNKKAIKLGFIIVVLLIGLVVMTAFAIAGKNTPKGKAFGWHGDRGHSVQLGPRPYFLVEDMDASDLKADLQQCSEGPFKRTDFSIGHRGAALQFPEHTQESYVAAARMGAGIIECDVTFTEDRELVCRHSQCDLHTTTNILAIPELAAKCSEDDYTQEDYAQQMIDEYKAARVNPKKVFAQSFNLDDVLYWINNEPRFGRQAVFLDGRYGDLPFDHTNPSTWSPSMEELVAEGVNIIAPPMWMLMALDGSKNIVPSTYAMYAKAAGLDIITWTLERSGFLKNGGGFYYQTVTEAINNDGDAYVALDVLAQDVGILGIFSDWPATVTFYANCMRLK